MKHLSVNSTVQKRARERSRALVVRDGKRTPIAGRDVVCGDAIVLGEGDRVAADATLISSEDLLVDESLLTGESVPVRKRPPTTASDADIASAESIPGVFAGTLVVRGTATATVRATGNRTEMGKIGRVLGSIDTEQPHLQRQLHWLVRDFAIVGALAGGLTILLYGLLRGSWLEATLAGIALGMTLLPEEFPLVMAVFMAMGAWRISRARVLTRRASAIETLESTTVLCTDKTDTLTENRMTVVSIVNTDSRWEALHRLWGALRPRSTPRCWLVRTNPIDPMDVAIHTLIAQQEKVRGDRPGP